MKYRFNEELDAKGKPQHLHQISEDGKLWKNLTGTSSIVDVLAKVLTWWASGKAVETLGWTYPKIKDDDGKIIGEIPQEERLKASEPIRQKILEESPEQYLQRLDDAYKAHSVQLDKTAKAGTDLHAELERFVKHEMGKNKENGFDPKIQPFIDWSKENVKKFIASEVHTYSERLWVGGVVDAVAELKDGNFAIIDFKSAKEVYPSHIIQTAGYSIELEETGMFSKDGKSHKKFDNKITSLIVVPFGSKVFKPQTRNNVDEWKQGFEWARGLYKLMGLEKI
jgi:hypothetical protein